MGISKQNIKKAVEYMGLGLRENVWEGEVCKLKKAMGICEVAQEIQ